MSLIIELGEFAPDLAEVIRQLKQDMKDDWYPDSLNYEDALNPEVAGRLIATCFERNHGLFVPEGRTALDVPKKGFTLRCSLEMSLLDRLYYQALVGHLIPYYDPLLPTAVLSHRYAVGGRRSGLFKMGVDQWHLFNRYVSQEAHEKPVVLVTDLQNFYENIDVSSVISVLEDNLPELTASSAEKAKIRWIIGELCRCLPDWCYKPSGGLPQNRDASAFLANLVMLSVDREMIDRRYAYFRYMDDIRVAARTHHDARAALVDLTTLLRPLGLSINSAKNKILEPGDEGYEDAMGKSEPILEQVSSMWKTRSARVIRRSFDPLRRLAEDLITRKATHERPFRFCITKFKNLALCPELEAPKSYFDPMIEMCIQELYAQPFSSDQLVSFLKAAPTSNSQMAQVAALLSDHIRFIYDWQNYLLWQLLVYKQYEDSRLIEIARQRAQRKDKPADRAGAILYLGAMGSAEDRQFVSNAFKTFEQHLVQRNALIAVHEIEFNSGIRQNVKDHVIASLDGTYKRLREGPFRGKYYLPLPPVRASNIYDEMSSYD